MSEQIKAPTTFISYSWDNDEHKNWVRQLAAQLRGEGVDVMLDQWHLALGDHLPEFMECAVRENDFVLLVCTPKYKDKANERKGGVGYEGNIMTGELFIRYNHRKFIPVLRHSSWTEAAPTWLEGKTYIDLTDRCFEENFVKLLQTLHGEKIEIPPLGERRSESRSTKDHPMTVAPIKMNDGFQSLNKFAQKWAEASEHDEGALINFIVLAEEIEDANLIQAVKEVTKEIYNGVEYNQAFANRPDIFSPEFIRAVKAGDRGDDRAKHLRIFLKYRYEK